jgi:hypothetical protein
VKAENISQDIEIFASAWSKKLQTQFETSGVIQEEIYSTVSKRANGNLSSIIRKIGLITSAGMFLFARLAMKHLKSQLTRESLIEELKPDRFPRGLEEVYVIFLLDLHLCSPAKLCHGLVMLELWIAS